jgi:hypothetical protein
MITSLYGPDPPFILQEVTLYYFHRLSLPNTYIANYGQTLNDPYRGRHEAKVGLLSKRSAAYIGAFNFGLRLLIAPISFLFTVLVARYLSGMPEGTLVFGSWQYIFILITTYFTLPADILSFIISRYAAEERAVGGIILLNLLMGALSSVLFFALSPIFVSQTKYVQGTIFFYISPILIILTYLLKVTSSVAVGRTPTVYGISTTLFQIGRLAVALVAMYIFNLSVTGVILAYAAGYLIQTFINMRYVKADLKMDMTVALTALRKSVVFIVSKLQGLAEATIVIVAVAFTGSAIINSYYESAIIVSNVIGWTASLPTGLIVQLKDEPKARVIESATKIFVVSSMLLMALVIAEARPLLHIMRPDYVGALAATYVISISNLLRNFATIFYYAIGMRDETLAVQGGNSLRGPMGSIVRNNVAFSVIGVLLSVTLGYIFRESPYPIEVTLLSIGPMFNSVYMLHNSISKSRELYSFSFPWRETMVSVIVALVAGLPFSFVYVTRLSQMALEGLVVSGIYIGLCYALSPYVRWLATRGLTLLMSITSRTQPPEGK